MKHVITIIAVTAFHSNKILTNGEYTFSIPTFSEITENFANRVYDMKDNMKESLRNKIHQLNPFRNLGINNNNRQRPGFISTFEESDDEGTNGEESMVGTMANILATHNIKITDSLSAHFDHKSCSRHSLAASLIQLNHVEYDFVDEVRHEFKFGGKIDHDIQGDDIMIRAKLSTPYGTFFDKTDNICNAVNLLNLALNAPISPTKGLVKLQTCDNLKKCPYKHGECSITIAFPIQEKFKNNLKKIATKYHVDKFIDLNNLENGLNNEHQKGTVQKGFIQRMKEKGQTAVASRMIKGDYKLHLSVFVKDHPEQQFLCQIIDVDVGNNY